MSHLNRTLVATLSLAVGLIVLVPICASAQSSSSETTIETRGVGFKGANVFSPKYKERIGTYEEQVQMGTTKGWLTESEAEQFKARLEEMKKLESDAAAKGWVKSDVDAVEKVFTKFNIDLTNAANKPASSSSKTTGKPVDAVAGGETKSSTKATTKTTSVKKSNSHPAKTTTTTTAESSAK